MNIAVLFDDVVARADASADEMGVLEAVEAVQHSAGALGHRVSLVPVGARLTAWCTRLAEAHAELVFNLCEGALGTSALEPNVAAVVELLGLPLTGSGSGTLALCRRKDHVNSILFAAGLPVPSWCVVEPGETPQWRRYPAIVKPAAEDASIGITQSSVARDGYELASALDEARVHGRLLVQEFVAGRELNAGIVDDVVLPIAEIDFSAMSAGAWPIVSYRAKWEPGSEEDCGTVPVCPAPLTDGESESVRTVASAAWRAVGGAGYGRVDLRLGADGTPYVLEINPNADLAPGAGLARMAARHGWSYTELVARIVEGAVMRVQRPGAREHGNILAVRSS